MISLKKIITIALCFLMIFVFSGCKKSNHPLSTYEKTDEERVSLSLVESSVTPEKLTIEITNKTDNYLGYSPEEYFLEQQIEGKWYWIKQDGYSLLDYINQYPYFTSQNFFSFEKKLKKGHYRIVKEFRIEDEYFYMDVEFEIK